MVTKTFSFTGLKKIKIPLTPSEINRENIKKYLPDILCTHEMNSSKIDYCYKAYLGKHDILTKTRLYEDQADNNNIIIENHLFAQVEFKKGYLLGNPKEYAQKETLNTDDIGYLNKYISDQNLSSTDIDVTEFAYAAGVGYYYINPRKDDFDIASEAPFVIYSIDPRKACKVYSSYIGEEELLDIIIVDIQDDNQAQKKIVCIYTRDSYMEFEADSFGANIKFKKEESSVFKELPLTEKYFHSQRISLVELGLTIQNAIDLLTSGSIDAFIDNANEIIAFVNTDIEGVSLEDKLENFFVMKKNGLFLLKTNIPNLPADIKTLSNKINHSDINVKYEKLIKVMYDTVGVPLSSGNVTSGGDTGQARLLGNGWESAYTAVLKDIRSLIKADKELLRKMLKICSITPHCKVNQLKESEIEIKYNINRSDNLLVKTQSLQNLLDGTVNMPFETALQVVGLVSDPHAVSIEREALLEKQKAESGQELENQELNNHSRPKEADTTKQ